MNVLDYAKFDVDRPNGRRDLFEQMLLDGADPTASGLAALPTEANVRAMYSLYRAHGVISTREGWAMQTPEAKEFGQIGVVLRALIDVHALIQQYELPKILNDIRQRRAKRRRKERAQPEHAGVSE